MPGQHSSFPASSLYRWGKDACPASAQLEAKYVEVSSSYAKEGTCAHQLATEMWEDVSEGLSKGKCQGKWMDQELVVDDDTGETWKVDKEMVGHVWDYINFCLDLMDGDEEVEAFIEAKLYPIKDVGDVWGTGDFGCYRPSDRALHIVDLKYGKGIQVQAKHNTQLMFYALGALNKVRHEMDSDAVDTVFITIYQPRNQGEAGPANVWECDVIDLMDFEVHLEDSIELAASKKPPIQAGEWCRFCNHAANCDVLRGKSIKTAMTEFDDGELENSMIDFKKLDSGELGKLLDAVHVVEIWLKELHEYAHAEAERGRMPEGYELKPKRATRKWADEEKAEEALVDAARNSKIAPEAVYITKLVSPAQAEKVLSKKAFAWLPDDLVVKESSGTNLVAVGDPIERAPNRAALDFAEE